MIRVVVYNFLLLVGYKYVSCIRIVIRMSETKAGEAITVCVRLKPLSKEAGYPDVESIISLQPDGKTLCLATPSGKWCVVLLLKFWD